MPTRMAPPSTASDLPKFSTAATAATALRA